MPIKLRRLVGLAALTPLLALAAPAVAAASESPGQPTARQVRTFLDKEVPAMLREAKVPGATVSVVGKDGQLTAQGYGRAALGRREHPVVADRTAFPLDSTGKLFTETAVMQLVEAGRLDLHTDVNEYLPDGFRIADTYPGKPITLAHLLTHSAGFEERNVGTTSTTRPGALGSYLRDHQLARIRPPGDVAAYSNYGIGLAGHIVEVRSGEPFAEYVDRYVLRPLGMRHTFVGQPDDVARKVDVAPGYRVAGDDYTEVDRPYDYLVPAGSFVSTATDMSRFMRAHLNEGALGGTRILRADTARLMHTRQFAQHPKLPGMAYGFHEERRSGVRLLTHSGDGDGSHGKLALAPARGVGIYLVVNGDGVDETAGVAVSDLVDRFVDRFLATADGAGDPRTVPADSAALAGTYRITRISGTDPTRLLATLSATVQVRTQPGGTLVTSGLSYDPAVDEQRWRPVGRQLYREIGGQNEIGFSRDHANRLVLVDGTDASGSYERLAWYELPSFHGILLAVALLVLLTTVTWPVVAVVRVATRRRRDPRNVPAVVARAVAGVAVALIGLAIVGATAVGTSPAYVELILTGAPELQAALLPSTLAAIPVAAMLVATFVAWWRGWWRVGGRALRW